MGDGSPKERPPIVITTVIRIMISLLSFYMIFVGLRLPLPLYAKLPALVGIGLLIRWFFTFPRKMEGEFFFRQGILCERKGDYEGAVGNYEPARDRLPNNTTLMVRLLAAYDNALQINKAKDLISKLRGMILQES